MLGKMFLHALAAAALVGSAAAVYAASDAPVPATATPAAATASQDAGNGYLKPDSVPSRRDGERDIRSEEGEHHRGHHTRSHDDDDD